jgi:hypothetical protein
MQCRPVADIRRNYAWHSTISSNSVPTGLFRCPYSRSGERHGSFFASTINIHLSAVRKLVGKARRNNMIGSEEAANLADMGPKGTAKPHLLGRGLPSRRVESAL